MTTGPVAAPLLLVPFLARLAGRGSVEMRWKGGRVAVGAEGLEGDWAALAATSVAEIRIAPAESVPVFGAGLRAPLMQSTVDGLSALAMETTVPATEQSRSDAGAKIDDND